jgi:hypothetical protein
MTFPFIESAAYQPSSMVNVSILQGAYKDSSDLNTTDVDVFFQGNFSTQEFYLPFR